MVDGRDDTRCTGARSHGYVAPMAASCGHYGRDGADADDRAHARSFRLVAVLCCVECRAGRSRSRVFRVRELRHARLWRYRPAPAVALAWADGRHERHFAVWLVDRSHFRSAAQNHRATRLLHEGDEVTIYRSSLASWGRSSNTIWRWVCPRKPRI